MMRLNLRKSLVLNKFIILTIISLGLYELWWIYKSWRFFQQKEKVDMLPALRALLSIIFLIPLLNRIQKFAQIKGYDKRYSPVLLYIAFIIVKLSVYLPDFYWFVPISSFVFLIPAFNALNYAKRNSSEFIVEEQESFNTRQIALIVIGTIFWILLITGLIENL